MRDVILVTAGTSGIGEAIVSKAADHFRDFQFIVVYGHDDNKALELEREIIKKGEGDYIC